MAIAKKRNDLLKKAYAYMGSNNFDEAITVLERIIELNLDDAEAWKAKGTCLEKLNRSEDAKIAFQNAAECYLRENNYLASAHSYFRIIARYLFDIETDYDSNDSKITSNKSIQRLKEDLDNGIISNNLRILFNENEFPLSEDAKVVKYKGAVKDKNYLRIMLKDVDKVYILICHLGTTNVYIENTPPNSIWYYKHAILSTSSRFSSNGVLQDINRAIELEPDRALYYSFRGGFLLDKITADDSTLSDTERKLIIESVLADYSSAKERNATDPDIWLKLIELNILMHRWDDAVAIYGSCKSFIISKEDQLLRSFLGCLALLLASERIVDENRLLFDQTITNSGSDILRLTSSIFLQGIKEKEEFKDKWEKLIEFYKLFIGHIEDWEIKGDLLERLECFEEAVIAYNKALEKRPDNTFQVLHKKGKILKDNLHNYEEALLIYNNLIDEQNDDYHLWYEKANLLMEAKYYEEALSAFEKVKELNISFFSYCNLWRDQAFLLENLNRYEEALNIYDKAIENGDLLEAWDLKINLLKSISRIKEADEALKTAKILRAKRGEEFYQKACASTREESELDVFHFLYEAIQLDSKFKEEAKEDITFQTFWDDEDFKKIVC